MPSLRHEAPLQVVRDNPRVLVPILQALGRNVPDDAAVTISDSDLSDSSKQRLADMVAVVDRPHGRLAVVVESQTKGPDRPKQLVWALYVISAAVRHVCRCDLVVFAWFKTTVRKSRQPIRVGDTDFDLLPKVAGPDTFIDPLDPRWVDVAPELAVLGCLIGWLDRNDARVREMVLALLTRIDEKRRTTYTGYIRLGASAAARRALEDLMTTVHKDPFVEKFRKQGCVETGRLMLPDVLAARGLTLPERQRLMVEACTDPSQLEKWSHRAVRANSIDEVFE